MHKSKKRRQKMRATTRRTRYKKKGGLNVFKSSDENIKDECAETHGYNRWNLKMFNNNTAYELCKKGKRAMEKANRALEELKSINSLIQNAEEVLNTRDVTDIERQQAQDELHHLKVQQTQAAAALRGAKEKYYQRPDGAMDLYRQYIKN